MADPSRPVTGYPAPNNNPNAVYPPPGTNSNGVAYPYVAPPPPQQQTYQPFYYQQAQQQQYPQQPYNQGGGRSYLRRLFSILLLIFIIFGTVLFIIWLVFRPRFPQFRVDNLSVNNFNLSGNSLSATWDLSLTARNPNTKMSLSYDRVQAAVFFGWDSLVDTSLPPFKQGKKNETAIKASFVASNRYLENRAVDEIKKEREKVGNVEFNVRLVANMRFEAGIWKPRRRSLRVFCGDLLVSLSSNAVNGALIKGPKNCRVGF